MSLTYHNQALLEKNEPKLDPKIGKRHKTIMTITILIHYVLILTSLIFVIVYKDNNDHKVRHDEENVWPCKAATKSPQEVEQIWKNITLVKNKIENFNHVITNFDYPEERPEITTLKAQLSDLEDTYSTLRAVYIQCFYENAHAYFRATFSKVITAYLIYLLISNILMVFAYYEYRRLKSYQAVMGDLDNDLIFLCFTLLMHVLIIIVYFILVFDFNDTQVNLLQLPEYLMV